MENSRITGWTIKDTARKLGMSTYELWTDFVLLEGVARCPELELEKAGSKAAALAKLNAYILDLELVVEHVCSDNGNTVYPIDKMFLCAGCYARYVLRTYGKEARFVDGVLMMVEYEDLTHLDPNNEALILRAKLYQEYLDKTKNE